MGWRVERTRPRFRGSPVSRDDDHRVMHVPLQRGRDRAEDVVVSMLGPADDEDHRGVRAVPAAQFVCHRDEVVRDRAVAAPEMPVLCGAAEASGSPFPLIAF